jgi:hypothetical protein
MKPLREAVDRAVLPQRGRLQHGVRTITGRNFAPRR